MNAAITRILYPTDFDASSSRALSLAALLARQLGAELHVLHVDVPPPLDEPRAVRSRNSPSADELLCFGSPIPGVRLVQASRAGSIPAVAILDYAAETGIDLIVMGAKRLHRGFGHLIGSVAREVVDNSDCPVLTVRHDELPAPPACLARVLVPFDFSPAAHAALDVAASIARQANAELVLLHVLPDSTRGGERVRRALWRSRESSRAHKLLAEAAATLGPGIKASTQVRVGSPVDEIVRCGAHLGVDLIVVSSHASAGRRMVSGSVAEEVQRFAEAPVLLVKPATLHEERKAV